MTLSESRGHSRAPIMPDNRGSLFTEMFDKPEHVIDEYVDLIVRDAARFVAQVKAAHVRRDDVKTLAQYRQLMSPGIPAFRKTVQEDDEIITVAALGVVQADVANPRVIMF